MCILLCKGFPSAVMLYLPLRHNGDWSPSVQSTTADGSHSCLPAFPTACVHQAPTSHINVSCWVRNKRPENGMGPALPHPLKHYSSSTQLHSITTVKCNSTSYPEQMPHFFWIVHTMSVPWISTKARWMLNAKCGTNHIIFCHKRFQKENPEHPTSVTHYTM